MAPTSYQAPKKGDKEKKTYSQSVESNLTASHVTVANVLAEKGNEVISIRPQDTVANAVTTLRDKRIGAVLVTDANGAMLGIVSERDIVRRLAETPGQTLPQKVEDLMTTEVVTCRPEDTLIAVAHKMTEGRFRHMPVVDDTGLIGIVTIGDVVSSRVKELEYEALRMKQMIVG